MPHWRKMTWAIVIWTVLMLVWGIAGSQSVSSNCPGLDAATCQAATAVGTGIGLSVLFFIWFIGFIILSIIWFMSRPSKVVVSPTMADNRCPITNGDGNRCVLPLHGPDQQHWDGTPKPAAG